MSSKRQLPRFVKFLFIPLLSGAIASFLVRKLVPEAVLHELEHYLPQDLVHALPHPVSDALAHGLVIGCYVLVGAIGWRWFLFCMAFAIIAGLTVWFAGFGIAAAIYLGLGAGVLWGSPLLIAFWAGSLLHNDDEEQPGPFDEPPYYIAGAYWWVNQGESLHATINKSLAKLFLIFCFVALIVSALATAAYLRFVLGASTEYAASTIPITMIIGAVFSVILILPPAVQKRS